MMTTIEAANIAQEVSEWHGEEFPRRTRYVEFSAPLERYGVFSALMRSHERCDFLLADKRLTGCLVKRLSIDREGMHVSLEY